MDSVHSFLSLKNIPYPHSPLLEPPPLSGHFGMYPCLTQEAAQISYYVGTRWMIVLLTNNVCTCFTKYTEISREPTHYVYVQDNPLENHIFPRGSVPSIRKGSYDLKSINSEGISILVYNYFCVN